MCLCLGPTSSGKTLFLKRLQNREQIDVTSSTVPTTGTNLIQLKLEDEKEITIREVGGSMAPLWKNYLKDVKKLMYFVDASNLCQISAAGVLFYTLLAEPALQKTKILLVLSKMDSSYRQMRNEALLMLQFERLRREVPQNITVIETSSINGQGVDTVLKWIQGKLPPDPVKRPTVVS